VTGICYTIVTSRIVASGMIQSFSETLGIFYALEVREVIIS